MASEYFSTLQYIWLNIVFFVFSLFIFAVCLYACLFVRWVYKRRLRQKTDEMIDVYKEDENKRKEIELNLKRQELEHPEKKKKSSSKPRKIHIVTKPCNHVVQKNSRELIVRQVNEAPNDEVGCEPFGRPPPGQFAQPLPQQIQNMNQQPQYVLVPVEMMRNQKKVRKTRSAGLSPDYPPQYPQKLVVENVATQTSDRSLNSSGTGLEKKTSEDWLSGFDERDGERIDVDEEQDEQESEKFMKRRREYEEKRSHETPIEVASDETRVSIENDAPPSPPKSEIISTTTPESTTPSTVSSSAPTSSDSSSPAPTTGTTSSDTSGPSPAPNSNSSVPPAPPPPPPPSHRASNEQKPETKTNDKEKSGEAGDKKDIQSQYYGQPRENINGLSAKGPVDKNNVQSQYYGQPGENTSGISSSNYTPPPKSKSPASRPSIFPYFVDSKAPPTSVSTSKASSKLTDPELDATDSSCALYRTKKKKMPSDSAKVYAGTPKSKPPN